jgi:hypothetical protein
MKDNSKKSLAQLIKDCDWDMKAIDRTLKMLKPPGDIVMSSQPLDEIRRHLILAKEKAALQPSEDETAVHARLTHSMIRQYKWQLERQVYGKAMDQ